MLICYHAHVFTNHSVTNPKGCTTRARRRPIKARQRNPLKVVSSNVSQGSQATDLLLFVFLPFWFKMIISTVLIPLFASAVFCSDVIELGDSNFDDGVKGEEIMLVEFFAPWYVKTQSCFRLATLDNLWYLYPCREQWHSFFSWPNLNPNRCGHCKRLAPEYEKAATTLKVEDPPIPLAKVIKRRFLLIKNPSSHSLVFHTFCYI